MGAGDLRSEEALRESEERFRLLVESIEDYAIFMLDPEGRVISWSAGAERNKGYKAAEIIGEHFSIFYTEEDVERGHPVEELRVAAAEGRYEEEALRVRKDGSKFWANVVITALRDEAGDLRGFAKVVRDTTERKRAEDELKRSESNLRTAQRIANLGSWEYVLDEDAAQWSDELYRIFGFTPQAFVPRYRTFFQQVYADDRRSVQEEALNALRGRGNSNIEYRIVRSDGQVRSIHTEYEVVREASGHPIKMVGTVQDITERKLAEARFRTLVEQIPAITYIEELPENDKVLLYISPQYEAMLGYSPEEGELYPDHWLEITHPDDRERVLVEDQRTDETLEPFKVEYRVYAKDGRLVWLRDEARVVRDERGRPLFWQGVMFDVTEQKRNEEDLGRLVEDLRRSNTELEQFAYVASHDLQEPLRMVSSYTQLLARRYKGQLDTDADEFMSYAVDGATRMQTLIQDLLAYSRVGTRGRALAPTDTAEVFDAACADLRRAIEESGTQVIPGELPTVMGDGSQLAHLFQNLIGNAIKFGGEAPVEVHVGAERRDGEWLFSVRDNGIGIAPEYAERIFIIFQRLHARAEYSGTGIGLAVCKKIVDRHGGRIWVESKPGKGSTFYFTLRPKETPPDHA